MGFIYQPEDLERITEEIPDEYCFPYLGDSAGRARSLLASKNSAQIFECARLINWRIEQVFRNLDHEEALREIDEIRSTEFVETSSTISEVRALETEMRTIGDRVRLHSGDETIWCKYEFFAVLTLWMLAETIWYYELSVDDILPFLSPSEQERFKEKLNSLTKTEAEASTFAINLRGAAMSALKALEAVNYAERLNSEYERACADYDDQLKNAEKLQDLRHKTNREIKKNALEEWGRRRENPKYLVNADANGAELADWLAEQKISRSPRVVAGWIRKHAKEIGLKLR